MTDGTIELDDLKAAWQRLDRRLARQEAIALDGLRHRRLDGVRATLRPLRWGQRLQIPLGVLVAVWAAWTWRSRWDMVTVRIAAFVVQAYGVALIVAGAQTLAMLARIDYGASVLEIQRRLATLQRWYALSGLVLGMAWWLLWLPVLVMLAGAFGIDLLSRGPRALGGYVAASVVGLLTSLWLLRRAEHSMRPAVRAWAERAAAGESLYRAAAALDEIRRFEADGDDRC
jgi:serine/threonine-protein kinase